MKNILMGLQWLIVMIVKTQKSEKIQILGTIFQSGEKKRIRISNV